MLQLRVQKQGVTSYVQIRFRHTLERLVNRANQPEGEHKNYSYRKQLIMVTHTQLENLTVKRAAMLTTEYFLLTEFAF